LLAERGGTPLLDGCKSLLSVPELLLEVSVLPSKGPPGTIGY